jgi:hypothetical protein
VWPACVITASDTTGSTARSSNRSSSLKPATDYFAQIVRFGAGSDPSRGTGVGHSFATDRPEGSGMPSGVCTVARRSAALRRHCADVFDRAALN